MLIVRLAKLGDVVVNLVVALVRSMGYGLHKDLKIRPV